MYGVGEVEEGVVVVGGGAVGISEVVEGNEELSGVNDIDVAAEVGGASRMVVDGQLKPAEDASRLLSIDGITGVEI